MTTIVSPEPCTDHQGAFEKSPNRAEVSFDDHAPSTCARAEL